MNYVEIERTLYSINQARFQLVCDTYLYYEGELHTLERTGSVIGKEKTRKGIPDTYFVLPDGRYIFVEATTQGDKDKRALIAKLKRDLRGCLNANKTGISLDKIKKVFLCCNSTIDASDREAILDIGQKAGMVVEVIGIGTLAFNICHRHKIIARDVLELKMDTGQVLTPSAFIKGYEKAASATSLRYKLYGREKELAALVTMIEANDIVVVAGTAGIGKSRLALEAMQQFMQENPGFTLYCLTNKNESISSDLRAALTPECKYLVLLDDVHRQMEHLASVFGLFQEHDKGQLKILLTTRDYIKHAVVQKISDYRPAGITLRKLDSENMEQLLTGEDFRITDRAVIEKIISFADGNPRFAVMAAKLWIEKRDISVLADISHLYDAYFSTFSKDTDFLRDKKVLIALGLVSFFHVIDLDHQPFMERLTTQFQLEHGPLVDQLIHLGQLELVDIYENSTVKISDQILATYIFHKVFIEQKLLSLEVLLDSFFSDFPYRVRDSMVPIIDSFGVHKALGPVTAALDAYWEAHKDDNTQAVVYLETFGLHQPDRLFGYIWRQIASLPIEKKQATPRKTFYSYQMANKFLGLLSKFFEQSGNNYETAINLTLEYLLRNTELIDEAKKMLQEKLRFIPQDAADLLQRHRHFFTHLETHFDDHFIYSSLFYNLFPAFMQATAMAGNQPGTPDGQDNTELSYRLQQLRSQIWRCLEVHFSSHPEESLQTLTTYLDLLPWHHVSINDIPFVERVIDNQLTPTNFAHCYWVHRYADVLEEYDISSRLPSVWRQRFVNDTFLLFQQLSLDYSTFYAGSHASLMEYEKMREQEIRRTYRIHSLREFKIFYHHIYTIFDAKVDRAQGIVAPFDWVLHETYVHDPRLGFQILHSIIKDGNRIQCWPLLLFREIMTGTAKEIAKLFSLIEKGNFINREDWLFRFFDLLPDRQASPQYARRMLSLYSTASKVESYWLSAPKKFLRFQKNIHVAVLRVLVERKKQQKDFKYTLPYEFFRTNRKYFRNDLSVAAEAYLQMDTLDTDFDHQGEELCSLLPSIPTLLDDLVKQKMQRSAMNRSNLKDLSRLWNLKNGTQLIFSALSLMGTYDRRWSFEEFGKSFFIRLQESSHIRAVAICRKFIDTYFEHNMALNMLFDIVRNTIPIFYNELIVYFISVNPDTARFSQLQLLNNHYSSNSRDDIWSEKRALEWGSILKAIQSLPDRYRYSEHIDYLCRCVHYEHLYTAQERKHRFMYDGWF